MAIDIGGYTILIYPIGAEVYKEGGSRYRSLRSVAETETGIDSPEVTLIDATSSPTTME